MPHTALEELNQAHSPTTRESLKMRVQYAPPNRIPTQTCSLLVGRGKKVHMMWPTSFAKVTCIFSVAKAGLYACQDCCLQSIGVVQIHMFFEIVFQATEAVKIVLVIEDVLRSCTNFLGSMDGIRHSLPKALHIAALL